MLTHWKKLNNPDYLGAYAFERGEEKYATIASVTRETITGAEGKKSDETVVHFVQSAIKPLILNSTNAKMIARVLDTPYIEEWTGGNIVLVVREVKAFGETVDAVRVKLERVAEICESCGQRITATEKMSAKEIAAYTRQNWGKCLCANCAKQYKRDH